MQRTAIGKHLNGTRVAGSDVAGTCSDVPYLNKRSFFLLHCCTLYIHVHVCIFIYVCGTVVLCLVLGLLIIDFYFVHM